MGKLFQHEEVKFVFESLTLPPNKMQWHDTVNTKVSILAFFFLLILLQLQQTSLKSSHAQQVTCAAQTLTLQILQMNSMKT